MLLHGTWQFVPSPVFSLLALLSTELSRHKIEPIHIQISKFCIMCNFSNSVIIPWNWSSAVYLLETKSIVNEKEKKLKLYSTFFWYYCSNVKSNWKTPPIFLALSRNLNFSKTLNVLLIRIQHLIEIITEIQFLQFIKGQICTSVWIYHLKLKL